MSDHDATTQTPDPAHAVAHDAGAGGAGGHGADHDAGHGAGHDDHGHDGEPLGPIDWRMWGVGVAGVIAALAVVAAFVIATQFVFLDLVA